MKCLLLIGALILLFNVPAFAVDLYVSPSGSDSGAGTKAHPFKTLQKARNVLRELRRQPHFKGAVVRVLPGIYSFEEPLELTADDSGTATAPIAYEAAKKGSVRISGGRSLEGWKPVTDPAARERFVPEAREHILEVDLKANGVRNFGELRSRGFGRPVEVSHLELFVKDRPMELARWPNAGEFALITGVTQPAKDEWGTSLGDLQGGFTYVGDHPKRWAKDEDVWVHGYWSYDWANSYERIRAIDPEKRIVETAPPYGIYNFRPGQRFYFLNAMEELDQPGEYYVDKKAGILYFWPPRPLNPGDAWVSVMEKPLIRANGASYVTIKDFTLGETRANGVEISGGSHVTITGCIVKDIGDWGILTDGGTNHAIRDCDVFYTGDGAIQISGGDRKTLVAANHIVTNNHLHHYGRWSKSYQAGVSANGVGITIAHNLIHDAPHNGILYWGNDFTIEYNEIHSVCLETGDAGAIYTGRDYTFRGNVIRYNFIHHNGGVGMGTMAVYMDDCVSGHQIYGNVFWNVSRAAFLGGGRDFNVENNIFVDCHPAVQIDGRGMDKNPVWHGMVYKTMRERVNEMNYLQPPYITRYPELESLKKYFDDPNEGGIPPENNHVVRNVRYGGEWLSVDWNAQASMVEVKDNLTDQDPGFINPSRGDFRMKADSPAYKLGFKPISFEKIGPQKDEERTVVPTRSLVVGTMSIAKPPMKKADGSFEPGEVRLVLENLGGATEAGKIRLLIAPSDAGSVVGEDSRAYEIKPGGKKTLAFEVMPAKGTKTFQAVEYRVGDSSPRQHLDIETK